MNFNTQEFNEFRKDMTEALKAVEEKYRVKIDFGGYKYSLNEFSTKMTVVKADANVNVESDNYKRYCRMYGFSEDHYRKPFVHEDGLGYVLIGFNLNAPKFACLIERVKDKKVYRATEESVKKALGIV